MDGVNAFMTNLAEPSFGLIWYSHYLV